MFRKPSPLADVHIVDSFDSGKPSLDDFLKIVAFPNQREGYSRTFVIADINFEVVGYYSLSAGMMSRDNVPRKLGGHGSPRDIPLALLGRLAVDRRHHGKGLGELLLRSALVSAASASQKVGICAVMVHALDDAAARFYAKFGFRVGKSDAWTSFMPLAEVDLSLNAAPFED